MIHTILEGSTHTSILSRYKQNYKTRLRFNHGLTIFLFFLVILCTMQPVQAADPYASQKTAYITAHPGQSIIPYPWDPSTSTRILPFNYIVPAAPANNFSLTAARNQFESTSFVLTPQKALAGIGITVPDLKSDQGNTLPASAINVRTVKVWYQANTGDIYYNTPGYFLTPELLLKDDSLVKVDYTNKINYLRVTLNGTQQYIDISSPTAVFPTAATVADATSLQPFSMAANENKQIWVTVQVPGNTPAGDYKGNITITAPSEIPVIMPFTVTVLPFDLEAAPLEYSLYYRGRIPATAQAGINSEFKTPAQYSLELQDMKDHGVLYPALYQGNDKMLGTALTLRAQSGLPTDHIYVVSMETGNSTTPAGLTALATQVKQWKTTTSQYGFSSLYVYGIDEATGSTLQSERTAWQTARQNGANIFVAGSPDTVNIVGDLLNVAVIAGTLDATQAAKWHSYGQKVFSYDNPQVGVEDPELFRKNYGFTLWNAGYDGAMDYAYQHSYGNIWNDYDYNHIRDHVFAYPTSNGVIDTVQWEGWREGVDDTRYLATLTKKEGNDISGRSIVSGSLSLNNNMATIRQKVIDRILLSSPTIPVASFTGTPSSGPAPLKVTFTDTSKNTPTSWNWTFGDGSLVNATARNPVHTYTQPGNYTVSLSATNAAGNNVVTQRNYITVVAAPVANFTGAPVSGTAPLKVTFTDASANNPTSWNWTFGDGSVVNSSVQNPVHEYTTAGNYTVILNVTNAGGSGVITCINYITVNSSVIVPAANFTGDARTDTAPMKVMFTDTSANTPTSWNWTFGDGSQVNATARNPIHTYTQPGNYTVALKATNAAGSNVTTRINYITVITAPVANFTGLPVSGAVPLKVTFTDASSNNPTSWNWTFGDGSLENATVRNPVHTYKTSGNYAVSLNATNAAGSSVITRINYITVITAPAANFTGTPVSGAVPLKVTFTDESANNPTSWNWTFGDGSPVNATLQNPVHVYTAPGNYTVTLNAANAAGSNITTRMNYISVIAAPVVNFTGTPVSGAVPLKVTFTDASTNNPTSWNWTFGDGSPVNSTVQNPVHVYTAPGNYTVTLNAANAAGNNRLTKTNYITVTSSYPPPIAQFTANITTGPAPLTVQFTVTSISSYHDITSGVWDVNNDGKTEFTYRNPVYTYQNPGNYTVNLTVTNADGTGSVIKTNYIKVTPHVNQPPVMAAIASKTVTEGNLLTFAVNASDPDGNALTYSATGLPAGATFNAGTRIFSWTPDFSQAGVYSISFSVSDGALKDTKTVIITVNDSGTGARTNYIKLE